MKYSSFSIFFSLIVLNRRYSSLQVDLPQLKTLCIGHSVFHHSIQLLLSNLPSLSSFILGPNACQSVANFTMKRAPQLRRIRLDTNAIRNCMKVYYSSRRSHGAIVAWAIAFVNRVDIPNDAVLVSKEFSFRDEETMEFSKYT